MPIDLPGQLAIAEQDGQLFRVPAQVVDTLIDDARGLVHRLLRDVTHSPQDLEEVLDPMFNVTGNELYLDRAAGLSLKVAAGRPSVFATVACRTLLVNLRNGDITIDRFTVDELRAHFDRTLVLAPGEAISCVDPQRAYRFSALGDAVLLAKLQPERDRPLMDYHHVFTMDEGADAEYQATIPFDFGAYYAAHHLSMAHSLGQLESVFLRHEERLLAGPTPFLWEAAKLFIRARHAACYRFLDAVIARQDDNFSSAATMTRNNLNEIILRAH